VTPCKLLSVFPVDVVPLCSKDRIVNWDRRKKGLESRPGGAKSRLLSTLVVPVLGLTMT